ncbi:LINE-1 reverse transcriptase-like [Vitis vinifera]|uniref:LINE-1 reverse transcriptase-like n=1 Tax=Vitis vinifera TaxID=29760 RepID=A0A438J0N4_VITVI|nr:LINE-1 reverse transcriptase-like [Vitis vinifera]
MFALARIHLAAFKEISKFMIASFDHFDRQAKSKVLWSCDNLLRVWVHFPILLEGGGLKRGPSPFRFENMWLEEEGFKDKMKTWWGSFKFYGGEALKQVEYWDEKEKYDVLNMEDCEARNGAREAYKSWVIKEEIFWRQKSRELWLKEGDNNTKFFHRMANAHSRRNWLSKLKVNGCWHSEENNLRNSVVGAFQELYQEEEGWRPSVDGISFMRLDISEAEGLEIPFLEEEVLAALTDLGKDKAPGPDGFTMAFWLYGWDVVKLEIMGFFREFHERGRFVKSLNATFLVLVPKKGGAEDLKDFRPISLVGSLYKLLAKVLANRIKKVMGKVISEPQNAFVEGRQILDAVLIANEVVDSRLKSNQGGVMCKLDIEKAYDHVDWKFLLAVLKQMGFGERWIKWIEWCISTVRYSVLINGSPSGFFQSSRGLRQGDPLSPYLARGRGGEGILISHLLFADDTLVFCEESQDQLTYLSWLLMWFEACSGLKVNLEKSELIPVGRVNDIEDLALELGCKEKVGYVEETIYFQGGKAHPYSEHPFQFASLLHVAFPFAQKSKDAVGEDSEGLPVGGGALDQKPHLVRWNLVCLERKKGGLGVRNLALMNKALLGKWNWRFAIEREVLWKKVISHKYGVEEGGWCTRAERGRYGVGLWKAIRKEWLGMYSSLAFRVGNGRRVRFWKDKWCGDEPLYESFPSLFAISRAKDAWVSEVWNPDGGGDGWTPLFSRALNDWEIEMMEQFMLKIQAFRWQREIEDKLVWTASRSGAFSVKSLYSTLEPGGSAMFPYVGIWSARVPPKVAFFAWEASWGKILTLDQLQRRGYSLANRCFLCLTEAETVDHLLLHCVMTRTLWNLLFSLFGVEWFSLVQLRKLSWGGMERLWGKSVKRRGKWPLMYILVSLEGKKFVGFWE